LSAPTRVNVLTQFRLAVFASAALAAAWGGQAAAFWPFSDGARLVLAPSYGGACEGCDLSGRIMAGARMTNAVFNGADFSHAVLARADASNSQFAEANFTAADLTAATLVEADCPRALFERAMLTRTDARGANFAHADFTGADVSDVNFEGANVAGADLRRARGLTQAQLDDACGDAQTRAPAGLRVRVCAG
jgi:uncharacterized protein YjbI with pentapeptide repeats